MSLRKTMANKARDLEKALKDKKNQERVKAEILSRFKKGKADLVELGRKITSKETREKLKERADVAKAKYRILKKRFLQEEKKAVILARRNPRKALAVAAAVGNLAGTLWTSLRPRRRAKVSPKRDNARTLPG